MREVTVVSKRFRRIIVELYFNSHDCSVQLTTAVNIFDFHGGKGGI